MRLGGGFYSRFLWVVSDSLSSRFSRIVSVSGSREDSLASLRNCGVARILSHRVCFCFSPIFSGSDRISGGSMGTAMRMCVRACVCVRVCVCVCVCVRVCACVCVPENAIVIDNTGIGVRKV